METNTTPQKIFDCILELLQYVCCDLSVFLSSKLLTFMSQRLSNKTKKITEQQSPGVIYSCTNLFSLGNSQEETGRRMATTLEHFRNLHHTYNLLTKARPRDYNYGANETLIQYYFKCPIMLNWHLKELASLELLDQN